MYIISNISVYNRVYWVTHI